MVFTTVERSFIVKKYFELQSYDKVQENFEELFKKKPPTKSAIWSMKEKFINFGSIENKKRNRKTSVLTPEKLKELKESLLRSPVKGIRRRAQELKISKSSCDNGTKILNFHPYRVSVVHELLESDFEKRVEYCKWFQEFIKIEEILDTTFFTDEAWFHLSGYVNSQNFRIWATANPKKYKETSLHPLKV